MSDVINLRQHRKAKERTAKDKKAEQNRLLHGRTKAEKNKKKIEDERAIRHIEGHKRDSDEEKE